MKYLLIVCLLLPSFSFAVIKPELPENPSLSDITYFIATTAKMYGVDPQLALYVSYQESHWNPDAKGDYVGENPTSFGLWQIHNPETKKVRPLTIKQSKDIAISTFWAMQTWMEDGSCAQWSTCPKTKS